MLWLVSTLVEVMIILWYHIYIVEDHTVPAGRHLHHFDKGSIHDQAFVERFMVSLETKYPLLVSWKVCKNKRIVVVSLLTFHIIFGLNIFYSEEKDWVGHATQQYPLQKKYLQKNIITHTHTYTHAHFQE